MKKILLAIMVLGLITVNGYCAEDQWLKGQPDGGESPSDIDALIQVNHEALDRLVYNHRENLEVVESSVAQVSVLPGEIAMPNSGGTVVKWRRNTSTTAVTWANIDTGAEASSTYYYVYAVGDTDITTCTFEISESSSAPTGATYYRKIGWFYNDSDSDIAFVGNMKEGGAPNIVSATGTTDISTTSISYEDMTDMEIKFVSKGRPVKVSFFCPTEHSDGGTNSNYHNIVIDDTQKIAQKTYLTRVTSTTDQQSFSLAWVETLSAGTHTIKIQWHRDTGIAYQDGSSYGKRILIVKEL